MSVHRINLTTGHVHGFTLVETLVALAIISIAIVGPFQVVQGVLHASYIARDQLIAASLAQEGMEYVREIRDSNYIFNNHTSGTRPWLAGLDGSSGPNCYTTACVVDPGQQTVLACAGSTCSEYPLFIAASYLYTETTTASPTPFTRKIQLVSVSPTETQVTVTVTWSNHGVHTVVLTENLENWL